ncbi:MAG: hypothetical protein RSE47_01235 [Acidaminococcaceae bacterium]
MNSKRWQVIISFLLALVVAVGAGSYRKINEAERVNFRLNVPQRQEETVQVDLAQQGLLKYYLQRQVLSFYGRGTIGEEYNNLEASFTGAEGYLSQSSKKGQWEEVLPGQALQLKPNGKMTLNIEVALPRAATKRYAVGQVHLVLCRQGKVVSSTNFVIINSKYAQEAGAI